MKWRGLYVAKEGKEKAKELFIICFFWHFPLSRDCFSWLPVTVAFVSWLVSIFSQICSLQCSLSCLLRIKHSKIHIRSSLVSSTVLAGQEFKLLLIRVAPRYTFLLVPLFDKLNLVQCAETDAISVIQSFCNHGLNRCYSTCHLSLGIAVLSQILPGESPPSKVVCEAGLSNPANTTGVPNPGRTAGLPNPARTAGVPNPANHPF